MQSPDLYFDQIILYIMSNIIKSCFIVMEICSFLHYNPSFIECRYVSIAARQSFTFPHVVAFWFQNLFEEDNLTRPQPNWIWTQTASTLK